MLWLNFCESFCYILIYWIIPLIVYASCLLYNFENLSILNSYVSQILFALCSDTQEMKLVQPSYRRTGAGPEKIREPERNLPDFYPLNKIFRVIKFPKLLLGSRQKIFLFVEIPRYFYIFLIFSNIIFHVLSSF